MKKNIMDIKSWTTINFELLKKWNAVWWKLDLYKIIINKDNKITELELNVNEIEMFNTFILSLK